MREVSYEELDDIRARELAVVLKTSPDDEQLIRTRSSERDYYQQDDYYDGYARRRPSRRDRYLDVDYAPRSSRRSSDNRSARRRDPSLSDSDSDYDRRRRRRHRHSEGRARSADQSAKKDAEDDGGILWYSGKKRCDANILERHLDSSYDGLIAAAAGGLIGSITAARFGGPEHKGWKALGGAVAGAAAFNVAENHYRVYTEERAKKKEDPWDAEPILEGAGEMAQKI